MVLPALFGAGASLLPSIAQVLEMTELVENLSTTYRVAQQAAQSFYSSSIGANLELNQIIRQSATVLAAQTRFFDSAGNEIDDVLEKYDILSTKVRQIQAELEIETRSIVGSTDAQTNAMLDSVITNFSNLKGQTKEFANEMDGIVPLVKNLMSAFNATGLESFQIPQEIRALLNGDINSPDATLAQKLKGLGLTKEVVDQAKAAGTFMDLLISKTQTFADFNAAGLKSLTNSFSVIKDITEQLTRQLGTNPTAGLENGLAKIVELISDPKFAGAVEAFANNIGDPIGEALDGALGRAAELLGNFVKSLNENDDTLDGISKGAKQFGQLLGDVTSLAVDLGVAVGIALGALGKHIGGILNSLDIIVKTLNIVNQKPVGIEFNSNLTEAERNFDRFLGKLFANKDLKQYIDIDSPAQEDIEAIYRESQDFLNSQGSLKIVADFVLGMTPAGLFQRIFRYGQKKEIKESFDNLGKNLESERINLMKRFETLDFDAIAISKVDTSALDEFVPDIGKSFDSQLSKLRGTIDFSKLSDVGIEQVNKAIGEITNSSQLKSAAAEISKIITKETANVDTQEFTQKLNLLRSSMDSVAVAKEELMDSANSGNFIGDISKELRQLDDTQEAYKDYISEILASRDPAVQAQVALIRELENVGKSTDKAKEKLKELETAAYEAGFAFSGAIAPPSQGQTLISTFMKAAAASRSFTNNLGADTNKVNANFTSLIKETETALKLGAVSAENALNSLTAAGQADFITIEQRLEALGKIENLIKQESELKKSILGINQDIFDLAVQTGELSRERASVMGNELSIQQNVLAIEEKKAILESRKAVRLANFQQEYDKQVTTSKASYESVLKNLATEKEKGDLSNAQYLIEVQKIKVIRKQTLESEAQLGLLKDTLPLADKKLQSEVNSLEVQGDILKGKNSELQLIEAMAKSEREREDQQAKNSKNDAVLNLIDSELKASGKLLEQDEGKIAAKRKMNDLDRQRSLLEDELTSKRDALNSNAEISQEMRRGFLMEVKQLETELIQNQADANTARLGYAQAQAQEIMGYAALNESMNMDRLNATNDVRSAQNALNDAMQESNSTQTKLVEQSEELANNLNNIEIKTLNYDTGLLEQALGIEKQLRDNISDEEREWLKEKQEIIGKSLGISKLGSETEEDIQERIRKKKIDAFEREKTALEFSLQQTVNKISIETSLSNLKLDTLAKQIKAEKILLRIQQDKIDAEQKALTVKEKSQGFLSQEDQLRRRSLGDLTKANNLNSEALDENISNIETQKQVNEKNRDLVIETAEAEFDFNVNVLETNHNLDLQNESAEDVKDATEAKLAAERAAAAEAKKAADEVSRAAKIATTNKIKEQGAGSIRKVGNKYIIDGQEYNQKEGEQILKESKGDNSEKQGGKMGGTSGETFKGVGQLWDWTTARLLGNAYSNLAKINATGLNDTQEDILRKSKFSGALDKLGGGTNNSPNRSAKSRKHNKVFDTRKAKEEENNQRLIEQRKKSDEFFKGNELFKKFLKNFRANDGNVNLQDPVNRLIRVNELSRKLQIQAAQAATEGDKILENELKGKLAIVNNELKTLSNTALLSYRLAKSSENLTDLSRKRQTGSTVSEIRNIADELIDFYSSKPFSNAIANMADELEKLRLDPNAETQQIVDLAQKIKDATEETAENTAEEVEFISVLDAIKQGSFFNEAFKDSRGTVTTDVETREINFAGFNPEDVQKVSLQDPDTEIETLGDEQKSILKDLNRLYAERYTLEDSLPELEDDTNLSRAGLEDANKKLDDISNDFKTFSSENATQFERQIGKKLGVDLTNEQKENVKNSTKRISQGDISSVIAFHIKDEVAKGNKNVDSILEEIQRSLIPEMFAVDSSQETLDQNVQLLNQSNERLVEIKSEINTLKNLTGLTDKQIENLIGSNFGERLVDVVAIDEVTDFEENKFKAEEGINSQQFITKDDFAELVEVLKAQDTPDPFTNGSNLFNPNVNPVIAEPEIVTPIGSRSTGAAPGGTLQSSSGLQAGGFTPTGMNSLNTQVQSINNNYYYPDNTGSTNSKLRLAGI